MYTYFSHVTGITHRSLNISEDTGFHTKIVIFITTNSHTNFLTSFSSKQNMICSQAILCKLCTLFVQIMCNDGSVMLRSRCSFINNKRRSGRQSSVNRNKSNVGKAHT